MLKKFINFLCGIFTVRNNSSSSNDGAVLPSYYPPQRITPAELFSSCRSLQEVIIELHQGNHSPSKAFENHVAISKNFQEVFKGLKILQNKHAIFTQPPKNNGAPDPKSDPIKIDIEKFMVFMKNEFDKPKSVIRKKSIHKNPLTMAQKLS